MGPPPAPRRPRTPVRLRALLGVVLLTLGSGVVAAVAQERQRPVPANVPAAATFPGVRATAVVQREGEFVARLGLDVMVEGSATGRGDTNGPTEPEQLRLLDITARGFQFRLVGRSTPLVLGATGRFASGLPYAAQLEADVVVGTCSVDINAPRDIRAVVRQDDGPRAEVVVEKNADVVRVLDDLVRRTCRRPRG